MNAADNPRAIIGANLPPSAVDLAKPIAEDVNRFLSDHPAFMNEDEARAAKLQLDRLKAALDSIEIERKAKVDPLNTKLKAINAEYHSYHNADPARPTTWDKLFNTLKSRLTVFARAEEAKRQAAAEAARAAAAEAERKAREAEERELEAQETAAAGVCDVDIGGATAEADIAFSEFKRADRISQRAEKAMKVRIGGGFGKVSTLRTKETLVVDNWRIAVAAIEEVSDGLPATIADAINTCARAYRKITGELPPGIRAETERTL
jgi:hypothetical protein